MQLTRKRVVHRERSKFIYCFIQGHFPLSKIVMEPTADVQVVHDESTNLLG